MTIYRPRLLLVDDEPLILEMFEAVLINSGFEVSTAETFQKALQALESEEFDVLISDVLLEDFDGFEIHSIAKKLYPNIIAILITGAPNPIDSKRASGYGIPYLSKPVGIETLIKSIETSLEERWGQHTRRSVA